MDLDSSRQRSRKLHVAHGGIKHALGICLAGIDQPVLRLREVWNLVHGRDVGVRVDLGISEHERAFSLDDGQPTLRYRKQSVARRDRTQCCACSGPLFSVSLWREKFLDSRYTRT